MDNRKRGKPEKEKEASGQRVKGQTVGKQPSSKTTIEDRHDRVAPESRLSKTIRAVTPEPSTTAAARPSEREAEVLQPAASTKTRSRSRKPRREHSASVSNTDDESNIENRRHKNKANRNGDAQSSPPNSSPTSFVSKTRQRLGSLATSSTFSSRPDVFGSIGYPSVMNQSLSQPNSKSRQRLSKMAPRRSFSANTVLDRTVVPQSPLFLTSDSTRILQLMKITCGRMQGILFFRPTNVAAWESGYCAINVAPGSLVYQVKGDIAHSKTLIPDLRGCSVRTQYDAETQGTYLGVVTASSGLAFQLRPPVPETFDSWLAALLCWQPLRPKGTQNLKTAKAQLSTVDERSKTGQRQISDLSLHQSTSVIKVGQMLLWQASQDSPSQPSVPVRDTQRILPEGVDYSWRRINCKLHENGHFHLLAQSDPSLSSLIRLYELSRNAIQHLHPSVLGEEYCIAIYPQYHIQYSSHLPPRPLFLALESRPLLEAWFVLLRAFTVPELYGPEREFKVEDDKKVVGDEATSTTSSTSNTKNLFRVERTLSVRITEARLKPLIESEGSGSWKSDANNAQSVGGRVHGDFYGEVLLDRHIRARTPTKSHTSSVFWAEEFVFNNLPPVLSSSCILIKGGNLAEREWTMVPHGPWEFSQPDGAQAATTDLEVVSHDTVYGRVDIELDSLEQERKTDRWWPLLDSNNRVVGDVLMKLQLEETVVLMQQEYAGLSKLLHNFDNSLTTQIAQSMQSELKQLADILLDIFQVSGTVTDWIVSLVDEEIDGIYRETPPTRMRFSNRLHSNDSYESAENRELLVRDLSRTATMEANLLFRGNSLLTKAVDAHMRRLGSDYLNHTIGDIIVEIVENDPDCEIDPGRVASVEQMEKNRNNLLTLTNNIWVSISASAKRCPPNLKILFRHIRSCAEDRYGSFIRTVAFTSVSGFLFLRLFCPALLNPKLFGLTTDIPPERPRRTLTLIAKTLIGLANMTKFGTKESWMEPMNRFLVASTPDFRNFIDRICSVDPDEPSDVIHPQYATPTQILERMPQTSREGALSLPHLLDTSKLFARIVSLWIEHCPSNFVETGVDENVGAFHEMCSLLHQQTKECLETAEQAGRPEQTLQPEWELLLAERPGVVSADNTSEEQITASPTEEGLTALPKHHHGRSTSNGYFPLIPSIPRVPSQITGSNNGGSSTLHPAWERGAHLDQRQIMLSQSSVAPSTTSSIGSLADEYTTRSLPGSRDGSGKGRFKWKPVPTRRKDQEEHSRSIPEKE